MTSLISRAIKQRYRALRHLLFQQRERLRLSLQLCCIALLKLRPLRRAMAKPFTQFCARANVFQPEIDLCSLPDKPTRPETVDENAFSVVSSGAR